MITIDDLRARAHRSVDGLFDRVGAGDTVTIDDQSGSDVLIRESHETGYICRKLNNTQSIVIHLNGGATDGVLASAEPLTGFEGEDGG